MNQSAPPTRLDSPDPPPTRLDTAARDVGETDYHRENLPPGLAERMRIRRELGHGGEATVWLCSDGEGNDYAVKLFRHPPRYVDDFGSEEYREHFRPECAVQVLERGSDHGVHFEVMEYCRFGTLADLLAARGNSASGEQADEILRQLAAALHGMQRPGGARVLVHGDIKPRNILVRARDPLDLVLTDFGLTVDLGDRSKLTGHGEGTIAYSAPGSLQYVSPESDWWSVGMVMFQVLVGRGYFQREDGGWIDDRTIEHELSIRDVSLTALDTVALPDPQRARWKLLLAGLLTTDPELRWGMEQIEQWRAGGTPSVGRSLTDDGRAGPRATLPFPLAGVGQFFTPAELGEAMAQHPEAAARSLAGRGLQALLHWLTSEANANVSLTDLKVHGGDWGPDELATYFVAQLAPEAPLTYAGRAVSTRADLRALALDPTATDCVRHLFDRGLVGCLTGPQRADHKMLDANWHDIVAQALNLAQSHEIVVDDAARSHLLRYGLLLTGADADMVTEYLTQVRNRLRTQDLVVANETPWFAALRREAGL